MPCVDDWVNDPLGAVQSIFVQNSAGGEWEKKVIEYFREKLKETTASSWVPSLNDVPLHYLKPNSLVKFRCMIQDMFDPEFYMGIYETVETSAKSRVLRFGKYKDVAESGLQQEVALNSAKCVTLERQTFYCIPVPGESEWVKEAYASASQARGNPSTSYTPSRHKRSYEEDEDMEMHPHKLKEQCSGAGCSGSQACGDAKRLEKEAPGAHQNLPNCTTSIDLNFPLPGEKGPACLVKIYEDWDNFKVNDVLEVYGILSVDPALGVINDESTKDGSSILDPIECMDTMEEQRVHSPPPSLVPRLHAIVTHKLQHVNPFLPTTLKDKESKDSITNILPDLSTVRAELLGFLTHALLGDSLAAEYLLLHLISTVYSRRDILPLGKFTVNLSGCPRNNLYTKHLHRTIQQLVPSSYCLPMTLNNMNTLQFIPHKDYTANRLVTGVLQLASNTSLMLDETLLEQGQLDATGVRNVTALGNLITWQKVDYDFSYHQMEFPCNINVLITSEGRSLLPSDCQVHLQPQMVPVNIEEYMSNLQTAVVPSMLKKFRIYLSLLKLMDYSISDDVTKAVEEDFVEMRKSDPRSITAEDLHQLLVVARLVSLSAGHVTLSRERWQRAKQLEVLRKSRLQQQTHVNGNEP
ncbi:mini-chromosome maintenance complex-binding protein isoform X1 [Stegostoma tigrinum]|uniref:mini-chromosome maintenance complex-binding protein isoform X1 n=2 Tax=Stegostoma tigrinum TaxID=3053191 RepID=UPI00202AE4A1|nr:mini-chromosome maintenance complex-binding protein isoform X1 [Stegostoma tigrinum]